MAEPMAVSAGIKVAANMFYAPFVAMMMYLGLGTEALAWFTVLLVLDMITGMIKAYRMKERIYVKRLLGGGVAKLALLFIPFVVAITGKAAGFDATTFVQGVITILVLSEGYSVFTNLYTINKRKKVDDFDVMSYLLRYVQRFLTKFLEEVK